MTGDRGEKQNSGSPRGSLAKRYFISRNIVRPQDYDEFWIRYRPERVDLKATGKLAPVLTITTLILFLCLAATYFIAPLQTLSIYLFVAWLISLSVSFALAPNLLMRYLYPTHIQLSESGIRLHWIRHWLQASSITIDWDRVSHVTTSDRRVFKTLSVEVEFNIHSRGISSLDKIVFAALAPVLSWGWISSDRPLLKLNINGIASSDDRKRLQSALKKYLPSYRIEPKVADDLNMYIKFDSYTDLWLDTLSASKSTSSYDSITTGTHLSNETYKVIEEIGSGGEARIYRAQLLKPVPGSMGLEGVARNETMVDMSDMAVMTAPLELEDRKSGASKVDSPQVVLKEFVLPAQAGVNARQRVLENIKAEAVLWRKLRHPNIVRLLDFFAEEQRAYLVLEHIEGQSLKALVEKNQSPLDQKQVIEYTLVMCDILGYLHRKSPPVIHRDFSPDNLILDNTGVLKLTDFNIALQLEADCNKRVAGKHAYIPPEQFRGEASPQSDIYAFGCTLHFLLTAQDPEALTVSSPKDLNAGTSEALDRIVRKCTEQSRASRYQSMNEIKSDLIACG
ncbi:MAG: serine/threonine protein kinase [Cyanobacteria bacterium HKST-UBA01]|nr:serine/threonine protein kinase [Cyanobacteria bacterium HKST-UBA01]